MKRAEQRLHAAARLRRHLPLAAALIALALVLLARVEAQQPSSQLAALLAEAQDGVSELTRQRDALGSTPAEVTREIGNLQRLLTVLQNAVAAGNVPAAKNAYRTLQRRSERIGRYFARRYAPQSIQGGTRAQLDAAAARMRERAAQLQAAVAQSGVSLDPSLLQAVASGVQAISANDSDATLRARLVTLRNAVEQLQDALIDGLENQPAVDAAP